MSAPSTRSLPRAAAVLILLVLAGCGGDLDTTYGERDPGSVNGFAVFSELIEQRFDPVMLFRLDDRRESYHTLLHLAQQAGPPPAEAMAAIEDWLDARSGRQFLLVLRDGGVSRWLLDRWIEEIVAGGEAADEAERARLARLLEAMRRRRADEFEPAAIDPSAIHDYDGWRLVGHAPEQPQLLIGLGPPEAPPMMRLRSTLQGEDLRPLVEADGLTWLGVVERGDSRLVVAVNATPLLDGALVDPRARELALDLRDHLADFHQGRAAWVRSLSVREGEEVPPSIMRQLFATPPFSWAALHMVALLLLFAWFKAAWLGRVNPGRGEGVERFARHVEALAWRLRAQGAWRDCLRAVARQVRRERPPRASDEDEARSEVVALLAPGRHDSTGQRNEDEA